MKPRIRFYSDGVITRDIETFRLYVKYYLTPPDLWDVSMPYCKDPSTGITKYIKAP